eukprot:PRCOL_00003722-RA
MFRVGMMYEGGVDEGSAALAQDAWVGVLGALETARVPLSLPPPALGHCIERLAAIERGEAPKGDAERLAAVLDAVVRVAAEAPAADGACASDSDSDSDDYASSDYDDASDIEGDVETTAAGADATGGADGGSAAGVGAAGTAGAYQAAGADRGRANAEADPVSAGADGAARAERRCRDLLATWSADAASLCPLRGVDAVGLMPPEAEMRHSCVPNCQLEARWEPLLATAAERDAAATAAGGGEARYDAFRGRVVVDAIALRDIAEGEELTVAMVATNATAEGRAAAMAARGLPSPCGCARCTFERAGRDAAAVGAASDVRLLADLATEEGRHDEAAALHAERQARATDGAAIADAGYARGAALMAANRWADAHRVWREAAEACPEHSLLAGVEAKRRAYSCAASAFRPLPKGFADACATHRLSPLHRVVVTPPLLSAEQCAAIVSAAEAAAEARGGWTTSRHYGVPTTDVPLAEVPEALAVFREAWARALAPALAALFPDAVEGVPASRLRVHDAFVVRYDSAERRGLPRHRDEAQISATLALNAPPAYAGGGTHFPALGRAIDASNVGGAVLFEGGAVEHAGEVITAGTRYIVAIFAGAGEGED